MENLLEVKNLSFAFGGKKILDKISFQVKKAEFVSILAANNGGKTTMIKLLAGLLPSKNNISLDNLVLNKNNGKKYLRQIGLVFSDIDRQFLTDTVYDELSLVLRNLKISKKTSEKKIKHIVDEMDMNYILDKRIKELGNFDKIKTLLALALIHSPKIVYIDDVFRLLREEESRVLNQLLRKMVSLYEVSVVSTSSNLGDSLYADKVILLDNAKLSLEGSFDEIITKDNQLAKAGIVIPKMIDISLKLKFYELLDEIILDEKALVNKLWK